MTARKFLAGVALAALVAALFPAGSFAEIDLKGGSYLRLRHEYWKNVFDLENSAKDDRNFFRFKGCLWAELDLGDDISYFVRVTDEFKSYVYYLQRTGKKRPRFDLDEVVIDNLYLDHKNFLGLPLDLRVGRQDFLFTYGEGFLIMDGTPLDGSRTYYFNAARVTWHMDERNSLDFVYINDPIEDDILPHIKQKPPHRKLNATDEQAVMTYWKGDPIEDVHLEGYYIFKREDGGGPRLQARQTDLSTVGSFARCAFAPWALRAQFAYQFGEYGPYDREGFGGYVFLDTSFEDVAWSPAASAGFIYLSGDDPSTSGNEGWDPLFSRWPWMSELYCLTYAGESGLAYWTNLQMWRAELVLKPIRKTKLSLWYNFLRANDNPAGALFGTGKNRGHLPQAKLEYSLDENISAYVLAEYFVPGNFYSDSADEAFFLRTELTFKF